MRIRLEYQRNWRKLNPEKICRYGKRIREKNKQILHKLKINGCAICGYNKCDMALEFHHANPKNKKYNVNKDTIFKKGLIDELNKCILLCANCHREIEEKELKR